MAAVNASPAETPPRHFPTTCFLCFDVWRTMWVFTHLKNPDASSSNTMNQPASYRLHQKPVPVVRLGRPCHDLQPVPF